MIPINAALLQGQSGSGGLGYIFPIQIILILLIMYFLMMRPQQKQRQRHEQALKALKKGDEIVTAGGVVGKVIHIRESVVEGAAQRTMEDRVTIESGESRMIVERGRITRIVGG